MAKKKTIEQVVEYAIKRAKEHHKYRNSGKKSWKTAVNCTWFVGLCFKDCGYTDVANRVLKNRYWRKPWGSEYLGKYLVAHRDKGLLATQLKAGDIVVKKTKTPNVWHSGIYVGNGKVAEAVGSGTRIGKLNGRRYRYAFRVADDDVKAHKATYLITAEEGRNVKKSYTSKSEKIKRVPKGVKFKATKKHDNWVYGSCKYRGKTYTGWINIRSYGVNHCIRL